MSTTLQMFALNNTGGLFGNLGSFGLAIQTPAQRWTRSTRLYQQTPTNFSAITTSSLLELPAHAVDGIESSFRTSALRHRR